jgi:hypothetical protein
MPVFIAHEFTVATAKPTGRELRFLANTIAEAVGYALYTLKLRNGNAKVGPSGRAVYDGCGNGVVVVPEKKRRVA